MNQMNKFVYCLPVVMQGGSDGGSGLPAWLTSLESETREQARTELEEQAMASTSQQPYVPPTPTVANDATFGQGVRDAGLSDDDCGVAQAEAFSGMTAEQRFMMDAHGYIRVPSVLSPSAVEAMRDGSFSESRGGQPGGFGGRRSDPLSFPDMEALATHPAILDVMMELMEGAPRLVQSTTWHDEPATPGAVEQMPQVLHSQRERDRRYVSFGTRPPGRISCNNVVVFVYLDAVRDGDGGLCVSLPSALCPQTGPVPRRIAPHTLTQLVHGADASGAFRFSPARTSPCSAVHARSSARTGTTATPAARPLPLLTFQKASSTSRSSPATC
jgi:hypothetical protein